jgi:hypothetical protein
VYSNRFVILNEVKSSQQAGITSMATNVTSPAYTWILRDAQNDRCDELCGLKTHPGLNQMPLPASIAWLGAHEIFALLRAMDADFFPPQNVLPA